MQSSLTLSTVETPSSLSSARDLERDEAFRAGVEAACQKACQAIAPAWPLDRSIAVNPYWKRVGLPIRKVAARMAVLGQIQVFPSRELISSYWTEGRITAPELAQVVRASVEARARGLSARDCIASLSSKPALESLPLLIDLLDDDPLRHTRLSWRQAITHQVSQSCAAWFDQDQADWQPTREQGLYSFWRETIQDDPSIGPLMGLPQLSRVIDALPESASEAELWVMRRLDLPRAVWADYLEAVLLTIQGWASTGAHSAWMAGLEGRGDSVLRELLAIRLAWGVLLLESKDEASCRPAFKALQESWAQAAAIIERAESELLIDELWMQALELGYQRGLDQSLLSGRASGAESREIEVQAAFCIDVRSEPMRRSLEDLSPTFQSLGFAGFFGLPIAYTPTGTSARRPQLPGLLAPALEATEVLRSATSGSRGEEPGEIEELKRARQERLAFKERWASASRWPGTAYSFVEAAGFGAIGKLFQWLRPGLSPRARDDQAGIPAHRQSYCRPSLAGITLSERVALASRVLHAMGLEDGFAPLVLLVGHGSQSTNNALSSGLDCGACCGQSGEVNARSLALLLNDPELRAGLRERGLVIPESTSFIAALHNTTTDEIEGFDIDLLPVEAQLRWKDLQPLLARAGDRVRRERAPSLGLDPRLEAEDLLKSFIRRANDGAETRPEWGLAGNAAFLIAPRHRSRGLSLAGRSFLHDYEASKDPDGSVLELLMTAPMLVTHWINFQYHASTVDPQRMGSGNKTLHNVVGGKIGVFEGNGGDLRIGLSKQSLYDGERWIHEPLRLTVIIEAAQSAIEAIVGKHEIVRQLIDNDWLQLWRFAPSGFERYRRGSWDAAPIEAPA